MLAKLASTKALARTALQRLRPGAGGSGATPISLMAKTQSTSFAIVGATADTSKPAFAIMKSLMDEVRGLRWRGLCSLQGRHVRARCDALCAGAAARPPCTVAWFRGVATQPPPRICDHARCSHLMLSAGHRQGFTVVPVNYSVAQAGGEILGRKAVAQVADCCGLEVVDIFNEENPYYMPM
jgi:predicted CoA-binding protein